MSNMQRQADVQMRKGLIAQERVVELEAKLAKALNALNETGRWCRGCLDLYKIRSGIIATCPCVSMQEILASDIKAQLREQVGLKIDAQCAAEFAEIEASEASK